MFVLPAYNLTISTFVLCKRLKVIQYTYLETESCPNHLKSKNGYHIAVVLHCIPGNRIFEALTMPVSTMKGETVIKWTLWLGLSCLKTIITIEITRDMLLKVDA